MNARSDGKPQARYRQYPYGVSYRPQHSKARPWIVKFKRNKCGITVGTYSTKDQAVLAASEFLRNELK